jgi:hypothetical protein
VIPQLDSPDVPDARKGVISTQVVHQACMALSKVLTEHHYLRAMQRTANAVTFFVSSTQKHFSSLNAYKDHGNCTEMFALQVIGWYGSVYDVINSFDIGSCQFAFTGGRCLTTRKGALSLRLSANFVNINDVSPQYCKSRQDEFMTAP